MSDINYNKELNDIISFHGNDEDFKQYEENLNQPLNKRN